MFKKSYKYTVARDVAYKTIDGKDLKGDMYLPERTGLKPAVLVVHGGGWTKRTGDMEWLSKDLVRKGFVVYNITYRLAPESRYPKAIDDVRDAATWLKANAAKYEINPQEISAWGYSAGAHLVLMVGLDPEFGFKSLIAGGTPADFSAWPHSPMIGEFIGSTFQDKPDVWKEASPVNHVRPNSPPVFLYTGALDHLVDPDQVDKMTAALKAKNVLVESYKAPFLGHIATYLLSQKSINLGIEFIEKHNR